jgi:hexosaminidase
MKTFITVYLLLLPTFLFAKNRLEQLIPQPVEVIPQKGEFIINSSTTICYNSEEGKSIAYFLVAKLNDASGYSLKAVDGKSANIKFLLLENPNMTIGNEGYTLHVTPTEITISANKAAGLFYGVQTLLQLLPAEIESKRVSVVKWTIPAVKIVDFPRFAWRGLMLDVSRHFFTKDEVKVFIDQMVQFKYNTLHLHLTDDNGWRIEIKSLPRLTEVGAWRVPRAGRFGEREEPKEDETATYGGFYTHDDIRELVKYAESRSVTIVPEIDIPGHSMAALAAYPELSCTKDSSIKVNPGTKFADWFENGTFRMNIENTLNPSDENVYLFLDKVFTEVAQLFPSNYIHVGGDECYKGYWKEDAGCMALMKRENIPQIEDLQGYFMQRVEKILASKGKVMLGWDEILEGGVSSTVAIMNWRNPTIGAEASHNGHAVVMTPTAFAYLDYCQGDPTIDPPVYANLRLKTAYSFEPVPDGANEKNVLGGQGNLWTENIPTMRQVQYMLFPRAWALSEVFWSPKGSKDWSRFINRIEAQFERSDAAQINYSRAIYDPIIDVSMKDGKMWLQISTEAQNLDIYYTIDDAMPDNYTTKYSAPVELPSGPITLRVVTYRDNKPIGHLITLNQENLKRRLR